jgi:hypothetical protein
MLCRCCSVVAFFILTILSLPPTFVQINDRFGGERLNLLIRFLMMGVFVFLGADKNEMNVRRSERMAHQFWVDIRNRCSLIHTLCAMPRAQLPI